MKIQDFQVHRSEIIQTDRYKAVCERLGIPYWKIGFLSQGGTWRGQHVDKPDFSRLPLLVTGHSDYPLNEERFGLATPQLRRWFSTNVTHADPRLVGIPLGVTNSTDETPIHSVTGNLEPLVACHHRPKRVTNLVYMNFSIETFPQERQPVFDLFKDCAFVTKEPVSQSVAGHQRFLQQIYTHPFVLCPRGNGIDTHRMWEALYLKSIPIVRRCHAMRSFEDLPILFVDRWEEALDPKRLQRTYDEFHKRDWRMEKLNISYWEEQFRQAQEDVNKYAGKGPGRHTSTNGVGMKIDRVIVSTDNDETYKQFWPLIARAWRKLLGATPTLAMIGDSTIDESLGDVIRFQPIPGIPTSFSAQVVRAFLPALFPDDTCLISDIDMLPLSANYFTQLAAPVSDKNLLIYSSDAYGPDEHKYPMCYLAGKGAIFREITGLPHSITIDDIQNQIRSWHAMELGWRTDEVVLGRLIHAWQGYAERCVKLARGWDQFAHARIDRTVWNIDLQRLAQGSYIDAHLPRPFHKHRSDIQPLIDHLRIDQKELHSTIHPLRDRDDGRANHRETSRSNRQKKREETVSIEQSTPDVDRQPLVSAIVSAYNSERFLRGCLEDLEAQTIADRLEIIVVDTGSPQAEWSIVREFQQRYGNIIYIRTAQRESLYAAWNRGIQAARGTYITNANTDDRHKRGAFERMVATLEARPEIALVYADAHVTTTENETFEHHTLVGELHWPDFDPAELLRRCCVGPQPMWRKALHATYGYFDESFEVAGDWEFWLRLAENETFLHLREYLGLYLSSPTGIENRNHALLGQENARIQQQYAHRAEQQQNVHHPANDEIDFDHEYAQMTQALQQLAQTAEVQQVFQRLQSAAAAEPQRTNGTSKETAWHRPAPRSNLPPVSCLCLTYGRPHLLEEAIYSFLQQDYAGPKELIVLNDYAQQQLEFEHPEVRVINLPRRVRTVGEKRNMAAALASYDLLFPWDDDDICLPHRLSLSVERFDPAKGYFKASSAWFWNDGQLSGPCANTFHGISCWSRKVFDAVRGYGATGAGEDKMFERLLERECPGSTRASELRMEEIYYIYRWLGTDSYHMSQFGTPRPGINMGHGEVEEFVKERACRGEIHQGRIPLQPCWKTDYRQLASSYIQTVADEKTQREGDMTASS